MEAFIWLHIHTWGLTSTTSVWCAPPTHTHRLLQVCFRVFGLWSVWMRYLQCWTGWASGCKQDYWISGCSPDVAALFGSDLLPGAFFFHGHVLRAAVSCVLLDLECISSVSPRLLCLFAFTLPHVMAGNHCQQALTCREDSSSIICVGACVQSVWLWSLGCMQTSWTWADDYFYLTWILVDTWMDKVTFGI